MFCCHVYDCDQRKEVELTSESWDKLRLSWAPPCWCAAVKRPPGSAEVRRRVGRRTPHTYGQLAFCLFNAFQLFNRNKLRKYMKKKSNIINNCNNTAVLSIAPLWSLFLWLKPIRRPNNWSHCTLRPLGIYTAPVSSSHCENTLICLLWTTMCAIGISYWDKRKQVLT